MVESAAFVSLGFDGPSDSIRQFHLDFGVLVVLTSVAGKCKDSLIRRKVIYLMLAGDIQEGIWSSALTAQVLKRLVAPEEHGRVVRSSKDIPEDARVRKLDVKIGNGGKLASIKYTFGWGIHEESFAWQ